MPSKETDTKVVQMQFDNQQFESGVKQTIKSLDDLKKQLNFDEATKSLNNLNQNVNKIDFSTLNKALEATQKRFSIWGQMGEAAINRVVNNVMAKTEQLTKSLTIDQVSAGWQKYESVLTSTRTIMSATGATADDVSKQLKMLMTFANETSYSYADMADSMGKFAAKGFGGTSGKEAVEVARQVSEGIAIWAAQAGQNAQTAARATYQMSQISGWMKLQDWRSIVNANMATKQFMQLSMAIAQTDGTLKKVGNTFYTTGKAAKEGLEVNIENFQDTLTQGGWLTTDVFTKTMQQYNSFFDATQKVLQAAGKKTSHTIDGIVVNNTTDAMDAIKKGGKEVTDLVGDWSDEYHQKLIEAFESGQVSKTFSDSIDATKDAVSSAFTDIFNVIFGNVKQAETLFTDVTDVMYDTIVQPFSDISEAFDEFNQNGKNFVDIDGEETKLNKFTAGIYNMMEGIRHSIMLVQDAFSKLIPPITVKTITNLANRFYAWSKKFADSTVFTSFKKASKDIDEVVDKAVNGSGKVQKAVKAVQKPVEDLSDVINRVIRGDFANAPDRFNKLAQAGYNWAKVQNGVNEKLGNGFRYSQEQIDAAEKQIPGYTEKVEQASKANGEVAKAASKAGNEIATSSEKATKETKKAFEGVNTMSWGVIAAMSNADKFHTALGGVADGLGLVLDVGKGVVNSVIKPILNYALPKVITAILTPLAKLGDLISTIRGNLKGYGILDNFFGKIKSGILTAEGYVDKFFATVKQNDAFQTFIANLSVLGQNVKSVFGTALGTVGDFFKGIGKGISGAIGGADVGGVMNTVVSGFFGVLNKVFNALKPVGNIIKNFFDGIRSSVKGIDWTPIVQGLGQFAGVVGKLIGSGIEKATELIKKFWNAYEGTHSGKNPFQQVTANITSFLKGAPFKALTKIFSTITSRSSGMFSGIAGGLSQIFGWLNPSKLNASIDILGRFGKSMIDVDDGSQKLRTGVGGVTKALSPFTTFMDGPFKSVVNFLKPVGDILGNAGQSIKTFFQNINWATVVDVAKVGSVLILADKIGKTIDSFKRIADSFSSVGKSVTGFVDQLTDNAKKRTNAKVFKDMAVGIAILAGSLFLLCQVDSNKLIAASVALGVLTAELGGLSIAMSILSKDSKGLSGLANGAGFVLIATGIVMLASQLEPLAKMKWGDFGSAAGKILILGGIVIALSTVYTLIQQKLLGSNEISKGQFLSLIGNAISLWIFADTLSKVVDSMIEISQSESIIDNFGKTIVILGVAMGSLAAVSFAASKVKAESAVGVLALVFAIKKWLDTLQYIADYDMDGINKNLGKIKSVIGQLIVVVALFGVAARIGGGGKAMASVAAVIISIGITVRLIAGAIKKIGQLSDSEVTRATMAIDSIIVFLGVAGGMILACNKGNLNDSNMKYLAKTFVGMGAAVVLCAVAIKMIAGISKEQIGVATAAIDSIILCLGHAAKVAQPSKEASAAFIALGITMIAMAVVVKMLSDLITNYGLGTAILATGMLDSMLWSLAAVFKTASGIDHASAAVSIGLMIGVIASMAVLINNIASLPDPKGAAAVIGSLDGMFVAMAVLTQVAANVGDLASFTTILKGLGKIFAVGGIVAAVVAGVAAIITGISSARGGDGKGIEWLTEQVTKLGDLLGAIGTALGKGIGNFAGQTVTSTLDSIDLSSLKKIVDQISDFLNEAKKVGDDKQGLKTLKSLGKVTDSVSDVVDSFSRLSQKSMTWKEDKNLNKNLSEYADALRNFGEKSNGLDQYQASFTAAKTASKALQELSDVVKPGFTDVLISIFTGKSSWESIGEGLGQFGTGMLMFGMSMMPFQNNPKLVSAMNYGVQAGEKIAELKDKVPTVGGLKRLFSGDGSWSSIGDGLADFGEAMYRFGVAVYGLNSYDAALTYVCDTLAPKLIDLKKAIPDDGVKGWLESVFSGGDKSGGGSWSSIGDGLADFGTAMKKFGKNLGGIQDYMSDIDAVGPLMQKITNMCYSMQDGFDISSFVTMSSNLPALGSNLKGFGDNVKGFAVSGDSPVFSAMEKLKQIATTPGDLDGLGAGIKKISKALTEFVSSANGFTLDTTSGVFGALNQLKAYAETFVADGTIDQFTSLGQNIIDHLSTGLADKDGKIQSAVQKAVTAAATAVKDNGDVASKYKSVGEKLISSIAKGAKSDSSKSTLSSALSGTVKSAIKSVSWSTLLHDAGAQLMVGLAQGISGNLRPVIDAMGAAAANTNKTFRITTEVASPSKLYRRYGGYLMQGLAQGITKDTKRATKSMERAAYSVNDAASRNLDANFDSNLAYATADFGASSYRMASSIAGAEQTIRAAQIQQDDNNQNEKSNPEDKAEYTINVPLSIDGRQIAKATAVYNREELNRRDRFEARKSGRY